MKKFISLIVALCMALCSGAALAAEPIAITITPLDYQTGKPVSKSYVENELFLLRVDISIPRFAGLDNLSPILEVDGVEIEEQDVILADGTYYISGVVTAQPAALTVKIKDMAYDNAITAEELYNAMQNDRTVSATYYFYGAANDNNNIIIPKTGDMSVIGPALALLACAAVCLRKRR